VISPSSYRVLYKLKPGKAEPGWPNFTLEHGITGPPLDRKVNLELRRATFYKEASEVSRTLMTTMFVSFIATQIQANHHGRHISGASKQLKRVFWRLEDDTPEKDGLAVEYEVLAMMKSSPNPRSHLCSMNERVDYSRSPTGWYAFPKEVQKPLPIAEGISPTEANSKKMKVSSAKKRDDTRKRVSKWRDRQKKANNSFRTINELHSSVEFQRELESRSGSISAAPCRGGKSKQSGTPDKSQKALGSTRSRSASKKKQSSSRK
jgi:hypothetical protein